MLEIGVFLVEKELKFKIYNKLLNKCFKVTRIDYMDEVIYYFDREKDDEDIVSFQDSVLLMPTGIYDSSGREIFEGDVISYQENSFTYKKTAEIIYEDGTSACHLKDISFTCICLQFQFFLHL